MDITTVVDLGVGLGDMLHERLIRTSRMAFHFRNTRALRLVIRSRCIPRHSYWLIIRSRVRRKRRFLRGSVFVISAPIPIRYSSVAGDVAIAGVVVMMLVFSGQGSGTNGTELGVLHAFVLVFAALALPEASLAVAGGVVVGGARTVAFFALVSAGEENFEGGADEEEEAGGGVSLCSGSRSEEGCAYAAMMATMKVTLCNWQERCSPGPMGELLTLPQEFLPALARMAMAIKAPQKQMSRTTPRKEKNVMPPRKHVRITAKAV